MAWHSGKPADTDFLSASVQHIRENFAELEPLHPHVAELVDLTALQPHVAELVDLTALHPHIAALLDSRIVEMGSNANGWYVRLENGVQVCWALRNLGPITYGSGSLASMYRSELYTHAFPAVFTAPPVIGVAAWREEVSGGDEAVVGAFCRGVTQGVIRNLQGWSAAMSDKDIYASWIAIGRWK